jgi:hypothetical protein
MSIHFPAVKTTLLLVAMTLFFGALTFTPARAGALTNAQQKSCQNQWDGKTLDLSNNQQNQKFKDFKKSNCSGYCGFQFDEASNTATINCPAQQPGGGNNGGGGGSNCADTSTAACSISDPALSSGGCTGKNCSFIDAYINPTIKLLSVLVGITAVIFIIFGAIQVSSSGGDPQKSASGKMHIRNALIGMVAYVLLVGLLGWLVPGSVL